MNNEIDISLLPSLPMTELSTLPQDSGIYIVVNEAMEVFYIGQSININIRWRAHHVYQSIKNEVDNLRLFWLTVSDEAERLKMEVEMIRQFRPRLNSKHNGVTMYLPLANPLPESDRNELKMLIQRTRLTMSELGKELDIDPGGLTGYCTGTRKPRHPAMLKKALQMVILEQRGIVTAKLIEQVGGK